MDYVYEKNLTALQMYKYYANYYSDW